MIFYWLVVCNMNFTFPYIGNNNPNPNWLIFFRRAETTNQYYTIINQEAFQHCSNWICTNYPSMLGKIAWWVLLKPDAMFLPHGPRKEYLAGPFPYGVDRAAIAKAFKQVQWDVKPLQPTAPVQPRRGCHNRHNQTQAKWAEHTNAFSTGDRRSHHPVSLWKHTWVKGCQDMKDLLNDETYDNDEWGLTQDADPWTKRDPWRSYKPSGPPAATSADTAAQPMELTFPLQQKYRGFHQWGYPQML